MGGSSQIESQSKMKRMRTSESSVNNEKGQSGTVRFPSMISKCERNGKQLLH